MRIDFERDLTTNDVATLRVEVDGAILYVMVEPSFDGDVLIVEGLHVHGDGLEPNALGVSRLRMLILAAMEEFDVGEIVVGGATRTTGANPGRKPRPLRFTSKVAADAG